MKRPYQGKLDALCGIYCLTLALGGRTGSKLAGRTPTTRDQNIFRRLVQSAEDQNLLKAAKIACLDNGGFTDEELVKIFNGVDQRFRNGLEAFVCTEKFHDYDGGYASIGRIIDAGGLAVISTDADRHWVLAYKRLSNRFACRDPYAHKPNTTKKTASSSDGVALLPRMSE